MDYLSIREKADDLFDSITETGAPIVCGMMLSGVLGTAVPGVMSSMLAYQQKRQERMYISFMEKIKEDIEVIESNLSRLNTVSLLNFKDKYFGFVSDYVFQEVQEEKIKYLETGLVNLSLIDDVKEDFVLYYYDTLKDLRILDLMVLKVYIYVPSIQNKINPIIKIMDDYGLSTEQVSSIREKLERHGLIISKRDAKEDNLYKNIELLQTCIKDISVGKTIKNIRFNNLNKNDTYEITRFGRNFLKFFDDRESFEVNNI